MCDRGFVSNVCMKTHHYSCSQSHSFIYTVCHESSQSCFISHFGVTLLRSNSGIITARKPRGSTNRFQVERMRFIVKSIRYKIFVACGLGLFFFQFAFIR